MHEMILQIHSILAANDVWSWLALVVGSLLSTLLIKLILRLVSYRLRKIVQKTTSIWDDAGVDLIDGLKSTVIFAWVFIVFVKGMSPPVFVHKALLIAIVPLSILQVGLWGHHLIRTWRNSVLKRKMEQDPSSGAALGLLYTSMQTIFISVIVLIGLSNLGVDIGALLAGLGVGGIAVALAAQNILGDLLASLSIVLDKPFVIGDFIVTGDEKGTIEHIGIKTTRVRSLSGEQLILSNRDLLESRIHNYKRMERRRIAQKFGVVYSTPAEKLELITGWVKTIIDANPMLQFDRCHFGSYGASSLDFELIFFVLDPDYNVFMDHQQTVLMAIFRKFALEGVDFAFPTQSLYIEKFPSRMV